MTWTRLPDDYADRMALAELDDVDLAIDVQLLVWSNRLLTDGFVPAKMLQTATPLTGFPEDELLDSLRQMAKAGIWEEVPGGWQRDWSLQETAERVKTRQKMNREKQDRFRERSARCKAGDHSMCDRCEAVRNGTAAGRNRSRNRVPTRPDPTPREGREEGRPSAAPPALDAPSATPPGEDVNDWAISKGERGYYAQRNRMFEDFFSPWFAVHRDDADIRDLERIDQERAWARSGGLDDFIESERKLMRRAGGREKWLASQKKM